MQRPDEESKEKSKKKVELILNHIKKKAHLNRQPQQIVKDTLGTFLKKQEEMNNQA